MVQRVYECVLIYQNYLFGFLRWVCAVPRRRLHERHVREFTPYSYSTCILQDLSITLLCGSYTYLVYSPAYTGKGFCPSGEVSNDCKRDERVKTCWLTTHSTGTVDAYVSLNTYHHLYDSGYVRSTCITLIVRLRLI